MCKFTHVQVVYYIAYMASVRHVGVDEVGRGPLAGPVTVCTLAVFEGFDNKFFKGITDSKKLTKNSREEWSKKLHRARREGKINFAVSSVSARRIDEKGISWAVRVAISTALRRLDLNEKKAHIFLDGLLKAPKKFVQQKTIIGGDRKNKLISAASVVAKVHRDAYMVRLSKRYKKYKFDVHKGYGTKIHKIAIKKHGLSKQHRKSFCGIKH